MLKKPPLCLSNSLQKMDGESKVGLGTLISFLYVYGQTYRLGLFDTQAYQHIKSTLPSIPTRAQVCMLPIIP